MLTGDLNVAHRVEDLKNWKGNRGKSGFLPEEQAQIDGWIGTHGFVDVHRHLHGPGPGPYTWWSWRGKAFDNDSGWRIDYQLASAPLAARAVSARGGAGRVLRPALERPRPGQRRLRPLTPQLSRPIPEPSPQHQNRCGAEVKVLAPGEKVGTPVRGCGGPRRRP